MDSPRVPVSLGMGSSPPRGSSGPFWLLYDAHHRFVRHRVRMYGVREEDVPDVVQEVFVRLARALNSGLDTSRSLRGWFQRTAYRCAIDQLQRAANREEATGEGPIEIEDTDPSPEERMVQIDTKDHVLAVLDQLPRDQRIVLVMSDVDDMPMSEIAEELGIPIGTGYSRLHAARKAFERAWNARCASGLPAVAPLVLWDAHSLLATQRAVPELPPGFEDDVWRRLVATLGPGIAGASGAAVAGVVAAKAGVALSVKQAALGVVLSALAGAGLYAATRSVFDAPPPPAAVSAVREESTVHAAAPASTSSASLAPSASAMLARSAAPSAAGTATTQPTAMATAASPARGTDVNEGMLLETARAQIDQHEYASARATLARVKNPRYAADRALLQGLLPADQDGGQ